MPSSESSEAHTELGGDLLPPDGSISGCSYSVKAVVMGSIDIDRAIRRIAHEIIERNRENSDLVIVGLQKGGVWIAERLFQTLGEIAPGTYFLGSLDISLYRDDHAIRPLIGSSSTDVSVSVQEKTVILVDDVIFTGRTVRAALEAILDFGRPNAIQLAVMIDRGHRELPIRPDYVGKNLPTSTYELVDVTPEGVTILEGEGDES